jgi:hypothetical protein
MTSNEKKKPTDEPEIDPAMPSAGHLDEDEAMLRALRIDLPGTANAPSGIIAITVAKKFPKDEYFRVHGVTVAMNIVTHAAGI